jgi:hypothetical protein
MLGIVNEKLSVLKNALMSDKEHFNISGFINKQNTWYGTPVNRRERQEEPLHSPKVTVCLQ